MILLFKTMIFLYGRYLHVYLGKSFFGYISQVSIWDVVLTNEELISMLDEPRKVPKVKNSPAVGHNKSLALRHTASVDLHINNLA